jgi:hypothetical protein
VIAVYEHVDDLAGQTLALGGLGAAERPAGQPRCASACTTEAITGSAAARKVSARLPQGWLWKVEGIR